MKSSCKKCLESDQSPIDTRLRDYRTALGIALLSFYLISTTLSLDRTESVSFPIASTTRSRTLCPQTPDSPGSLKMILLDGTCLGWTANISSHQNIVRAGKRLNKDIFWNELDIPNTLRPDNICQNHRMFHRVDCLQRNGNFSDCQNGLPHHRTPKIVLIFRRFTAS